MKPALWILTFVVGLAAALASTCHYIENPKSRYANMQAAHADGAIERGWIPSFIPNEATALLSNMT